MYHEEEKPFDSWNEVKKTLDKKGKNPRFRVGEIYWVGVGQNIGSEIYGKGDNFARPVLIFKKINHFTFVGIPFTSVPHDRPDYVRFMFKNKEQFAILNQIRTFSGKRLYRRMGRIDETDMKLITTKLHEFFFGDSK